MPEKYVDDQGNEVELHTPEEVAALQEKAAQADDLRAQIKALEDGSPGIRNLREALSRKEERIKELESQTPIEAEKPKEKEVPQMDTEKYAEVAREQSLKVAIDVEVTRALSDYSPEDKALVKKYFGKLTHGEDVNLETIHSFIEEAKQVAFPNKPREEKRASFGGRSPASSPEKKGYGDTDAGKAFASQLGINIEPPTKK
jgi:hypothetical protein